MIWTAHTQLKPEVYLFENGVDIGLDGITIDGNGATIIGSSSEASGVRLEGRNDVVVRNLNVVGFKHGFSIINSENIQLENVHVSGSAEFPHNTDFLNIFHPTGTYPGGIFLKHSTRVLIHKCDLSHQMCGLISYACRDLTVKNCVANYNSGFGFYLSGTHNSLIENCYADFCCRWQPRETGGHMGADAAGFVLVNGSSANKLQHNFARLGGDGFFLAGLRHDGVFSPCNDNLFFKNDASLSPNISFEATFSSGNIFRENRASRSNYGFWLGFSKDNLIENNEIEHNLQAGIAVENGVGMTVRNNRFTGNGHGVLAWSKKIPQFDSAVPENDTSRDWLIEGNTFRLNAKAVRIAADQDHGIASFTQNGTCPPLRNHHIQDNHFKNNTIDIDFPDEKGNA